jgi:alkylhydroperoxidase family enzyme
MEAAALADVEWAECLVPTGPVPAALGTEVRRVVGANPEWLARLAPCPWLVRALCSAISKPMAYAPMPLLELVGLVVSADNSCRYCYGIQRTILRIFGQRDEYLDRLLREDPAVTSPRERLALDFARRLSRANPLPGRADFDRVVQTGLPPLAVAEIAAAVGAANFANRIATLLALPPDPFETEAQGPLFRLLRPLIARRMRSRPRAPMPPPEPNDGPCARIVAAFGDSPVAHALRTTIDAALGSPVLPRRTKLLLLAVIGRATGCAYAQEEVRAPLAADGLAAADLDQILTTLASPRLDERERRLVPFARETVRYQPPAIQRRMREVCRGFTVEETLETVGIVALANEVCRLSVVLDAC